MTTGTVSLLFIGNSYTSRNDVPRLVADLAMAADPSRRIDTRMIVAGGASLRRHWNAPHAREAIAARSWDWVVLQEMSTLPIKNAARYHENVREFNDAIAASGAKTALYLTWARRDRPQTQDALDEAVYAIAGECSARVVPVGPAWREAMRRDASLALHADDGSHPTVGGSYLAACVFVASLFGELGSDASIAARLGLGSATARLMHEVAVRASAPTRG